MLAGNARRWFWPLNLGLNLSSPDLACCWTRPLVQVAGPPCAWVGNVGLACWHLLTFRQRQRPVAARCVLALQPVAGRRTGLRFLQQALAAAQPLVEAGRAAQPLPRCASRSPPLQARSRETLVLGLPSHGRTKTPHKSRRQPTTTKGLSKPKLA